MSKGCKLRDDERTLPLPLTKQSAITKTRSTATKTPNMTGWGHNKLSQSRIPYLTSLMQHDARLWHLSKDFTPRISSTSMTPPNTTPAQCRKRTTLNRHHPIICLFELRARYYLP